MSAHARRAIRRVYESDPRKGPKRKSPWIQDGDACIGDTELILAHVEKTRGKKLDRHLSREQQAMSHLVQRALEEHYHQIFEYELIVLDEGFRHLRTLFHQTIPAPMLYALAPLLRRGGKKHLFERGIGRHMPEQVAALGRSDLDAISTSLGDREWFLGDTPTKVDASAFGLLAVSIRSPLSTPVCTYARSKPNLVAFVERAMARFFPDLTRCYAAA